MCHFFFWWGGTHKYQNGFDDEPIKVAYCTQKIYKL
jgi:hypothetical protein